MIKKFLPYCLLFLLILPLLWPLVQPGFFVSDDGGWMIIRLSSFHQTLKTGQFPVRFLESLNHGYGYPVLNFLYPLPFYLGEVIHLVGFGFIDSVKILFGLSFLLGSLFMYLWARDKWGTIGGLTAAIFYSYAPYRVFDVYTRGSLGEAVAFIFLPLVLFFIDKFCRSEKPWTWFLASISLAALILSHNTQAMLFLFVIFPYALFKIVISKKRRFLTVRLGLAFLGSLFITAWFWVPAIFELQFTRMATTKVADYTQYFITFENIVSFVGVPLILLGIFGLIKFLKTQDMKLGLIIFLILSALFFTLPLSQILWEKSPLAQLVQFPWRFLSLVVFGGAVLTGYLFRTGQRKIVAGFFVILAVALTMKNLTIQPDFHAESYYTTNDATTTVKNEFMPIWVKTDPTAAPAENLMVLSGNGTVTGEDEVLAKSQVVVQINTIYFPGRQVLVNGSETAFNYQRTGFLEVSLEPGLYHVRSVFKETPTRLVADGVSLLAFLGLFVITFVASRRN